LAQGGKSTEGFYFGPALPKRRNRKNGSKGGTTNVEGGKNFAGGGGGWDNPWGKGGEIDLGEKLGDLIRQGE